MPSRRRRPRARFTLRRARGVATGAVLTVLVGAGVVVAFASRGYPVTDATYHDGGVWVTSRADGLLGRFNRPIEQLDAALSPSSVNQAEFDVVQREGTVFVHDRSGGKLHRVDVADVSLTEGGGDVPAADAVALGGGTGAILEPESGRLWVRRAEELTTLNLAKDAPAVTVGAKADVAVGVNGTVHAVSAATGKLVSISRDAPQTTQLDLGGTDVQVTAVGGRPVVLVGDGRLFLPGGHVTKLPGDAGGAILQQPGPSDASVLVATDAALWAVPLDGGAAQRLSDEGSGGAAAPVRLGPCVHAAWGGNPRYLRRCAGIGAEPARALTKAPSNSRFVFRVNRDVIVLNELATGFVTDWDHTGENLGNWNDVKPRDRDSSTDDTHQAEQDHSRRNHPPVAKPDQYGVRPGQAAILPVLENDGDLDGDVVVIRGVSGVPAGSGKLAVIRDGQALQFTAPPGSAAGTVSFTYQIDDGRGGQDATTVTLSVRPPPANANPAQLPKGSRTTVELGGLTTYRVLDDWRDADGDALVLAGASAGPGEGTVRFAPDGTVTFVEAGKSAGRRVSIALQVTDGNGDPVTGALQIDVQPRGTAPKAQDDLVTAFAGRPATIRPLLNDIDPAAGIATATPLRLSGVSAAPAGTTVTPDYQAGTIAFTATQPNTFYLEYQVTSGAANATARIRVDVRAPASANSPVAVADTAAVRGSEPTRLDVLANDLDLDGDVLVVSHVDVPGDAGVAVSVIGHRWLRLTATTQRARTAVLRYTVSDGYHEDVGTVTVSFLPALTDDQPPLPKDDTATVRAGDVLTVDVLANDTDPDNDPLSLDSTVVAGPGKGADGWFVDEQSLRFRAPLETGTATATYTVRDPAGKSATAQVRVTIAAADPAKNQAPQPQTVEARVLTGMTVRIPVPLAGTDPDGDSVVLLGAVQAPKLGRIVGQGPDYLEYQAYGQAGADEFMYQLADPFAKRGRGTVHVGVAPRTDDNLPPSAADDVYTVAPGALVRIPVLRNDSDPDGDQLRLQPLDTVARKPASDARLEKNRLVMRAGTKDGDVTSVQYAVEDGRGGRATATATVVVRKDANVPPTARDDLVRSFSPGSTTVTVEVLANDDDVDGDIGELKIETFDPDVTVAGRGLRIPLGAAARQVPYRITDVHGASSTAFVRVPAAGNQPPQRVDDAPIELTSGQELVVELAKYVSDPDGRPVRLTAASGLSASPPAGLSIAEGSLTKTSLTLRAAPAYHGPGQIVVEVTDSETPDDQAGHIASIPLLVNVKASGEQQLAFDCGGVHPQAGAPSITVELTRCVPGLSAADQRRLRFDGLGGNLKGLRTRLNGTQLAIGADASAAPGAKVDLTLTASLGGTSATQVKLPVTVRAAPPARAADDLLALKAGEQRTVDVLANDVNPFPDQPMTVVDVATVLGDATAQIDGDGARVVVRVGTNFHGTARVAYRVRDAGSGEGRIAEAQILLSVVDKPDAPGTPVLRGVGDATVQLSWGEPNGNGAPVTGYEVQGERGFSQQCPQPVCQLTGLTNGATYHFRVRARNAVDWGPLSPPSEPGTPDVQPDQPSPPLTTFGDQQVAVTWAAPRSPGTPVQYYELDVSPTLGGPRRVTGTELTWTGLTNGSGYAFRVRAYNKSGKPSEWSEYSAVEVPAGVPRTPDAPSAAPVNDGVGQQVVVRWTPPDTNGAAISGYRLTVLRGGTAERTLQYDGDTTQATVDVVNGAQYTFQVVAVNKAGASTASSSSAQVVAHGKPAQPGAPAVSDHDGGNVGYDRRVSYDVVPPDDNGMAISRYEISWSGSGTDYSSASPSGFATGMNNGTTYRLQVRACNDMCGAWSAQSAPVTPYGRPITPTVFAGQQGSQSIQMAWNTNGTNGRPIDRIEVNIDGAGWENTGTSGGARVVGNGYNQTHTIQSRVIDSAGQVSDIASASATTQAPPPATLAVSTGGRYTNTANCAGPCYWVHLRADNFAPNTSYTVTCDSTAPAGSPAFPNQTIRTDGNGHYDADLRLFFGYPTRQVWCSMNGVTSPRYTWPSS